MSTGKYLTKQVQDHYKGKYKNIFERDKRHGEIENYKILWVRKLSI